MRAVVYDKKSSGDRLVLREVEKPLPNDDEVLVRIHAVSVNAGKTYRDVLKQSGRTPRAFTSVMK